MQTVYILIVVQCSLIGAAGQKYTMEEHHISEETHTSKGLLMNKDLHCHGNHDIDE